jgi:esterase/lipase superfamily enzyme
LRFRKPGTTGDLPVEVIDSRPWGSEELGADADVLLFVHGYNTAFDRAARWAATIAYDLRFPGVIALYSWPSRGRRTSYAADAESADVAVWNFRRVLRRLLDQPVSRGVHIVAYSAGCSVVLRAFESGELRDAAAVHGRVENIVFSAPDIDADLFAKLIPNCTAVNRRCTLYVSENDRVLALSGAVAGYPRAGHARRRVVVRPEVDTIDVSYLDTGAKGHGYLAEHERVIADLHQLIVNGKPPQQRFGLDRVAHSGGGYWTFAPSASRA